MPERKKGIVQVHCIRRRDEDNINITRRAQCLTGWKAFCNTVLGAILTGSILISPPHPMQRRLFALRKGRQQAANRMIPKAQNRKAHSGFRHGSLQHMVFSERRF
jgi:hypothetical protein